MEEQADTCTRLWLQEASNENDKIPVHTFGSISVSSVELSGAQTFDKDTLENFKALSQKTLTPLLQQGF